LPQKKKEIQNHNISLFIDALPQYPGILNNPLPCAAGAEKTTFAMTPNDRTKGIKKKKEKKSQKKAMPMMMMMMMMMMTMNANDDKR